MKQHEYSFRAETIVLGEPQQNNHIIEVSTNNYACYQALKEGINAVISEYEEADEKEEEPTNGN